MLIQEKVQNRSQRMTRENLILAKAIGTLHCMGCPADEIADIVTQSNNPETDITVYLKDRLTVIRSREAGNTEYYGKLGSLISDCELEISKRPKVNENL